MPCGWRRANLYYRYRQHFCCWLLVGVAASGRCRCRCCSRSPCRQGLANTQTWDGRATTAFHCQQTWDGRATTAFHCQGFWTPPSHALAARGWPWTLTSAGPRTAAPTAEHTAHKTGAIIIERRDIAHERQDVAHFGPRTRSKGILIQQAAVHLAYHGNTYPPVRWDEA